MSPTINAVVIPVSDPGTTKSVYATLYGAPHTDTPYYVGFNVDGFDQAQRVGRIVGAIGPALADEPEHFIRGRHCMPIDDRVPIYFFSGRRRCEPWQTHC